MPLEVVMPQMGESIAEGTVVRWLKKPGEAVKRDEPLFEISTDKVDTEIPSPGDGILSEIKVKEGQTVPVNTVVCLLASLQEAGAAAAPRGAGSPAAVRSPLRPPEGTKTSRVAAASSPRGGMTSPPPPSPRTKTASSPAVASPHPQAEGARPPAAPPPRAPAEAGEAGPPQRSSPLVRKIAQEHGVDISLIAGTGAGSRVTKKDILDYIAAQGSGAAAAAAVATAEEETAAAEPHEPAPAPAVPPGEWDEKGVRVEPMSIMRAKIAEHMVLSLKTSAHVTTVHEVDLTEVARTREARKEAVLRETGIKLTFLPFVVKAAIDALREFPVINASVVGKEVHYHRGIHIGVAVALEDGLIVPVIQNADEKSILGLARAIQDLAERARAKRLAPSEVSGGTFTVTNYGSYGSVLATPIINQPQVAILGVGAGVKRPVVLPGSDAIAIRTMAFLSLSFDHRLIDGATADRFLARVRKSLEQGSLALS